MGEIKKKEKGEKNGLTSPQSIVKKAAKSSADNTVKPGHGAQSAAGVMHPIPLKKNSWSKFWTGLILTLFSFATHFWQLNLPDSVCWDETHFGKFANYYIKREFYFDVHPPLTKMLIGLAGYLSGYDGSFEFKEPGQLYGSTTFLGMRAYCAMMGALVVPCVYSTMNALGFSAYASVMAAFLVAFDTGLLTLTRYILLDSSLVFFIVLSVCCYAHFLTHRQNPFSLSWWLWLAGVGTSLACAMGTKWVGLFVVMLIGVSTIGELWMMLGDTSMSLKRINQHFLARVLCLIILPIGLYLSFFKIHFMVLENSGPGDGFMSSLFQTTLKGNELYQMEVPMELAYGSVLSLKNYRVSGGLLHSHHDLYPEEAGIRQQQITTYPHKDANNLWRIKYADRDPQDGEAVQYVTHGDIIRLEHVNTRRLLHSHNQPGPITKKHKQVTGYGQDGIGDINDEWQVLLEGEAEPGSETEAAGGERKRVRILTTPLRLRHVQQKCYLSNNGAQLPKWGFEQGEVTCNPNKDDSGLLWNVESIVDDRLPKGRVTEVKPSFLSNVIESHMVMLHVNNNLKPKEDETTSRPLDWPLLVSGQNFTPWGESNRRIYLLTNPIVALTNILGLVLFVVIGIIYAILHQRGFDSQSFEARHGRVLQQSAWLCMGYFMLYLPFFFMSRVLYYHHYFPAQQLSSMLSAAMLDELIYWVSCAVGATGLVKSRTVMRHVYEIAYCLLAASFVYFSPWSYGMVGPMAQYQYLKWLPAWNFAN